MARTLTGIKTYSSENELQIRKDLLALLKNCPIPDEQLPSNLGLFLSSKNLARILFMQHIFKKIVDVPGVVAEFGTRWGQNLALFSALRGIYDPFNRHRKIVGFDTFSGFPSISSKDGKSDMMRTKNLTLTKGYYDYLTKIMQYHEDENPLSHIKKFELIKGDAIVQIDKYLKKHPQTIIALAFFDFDLYRPTKKCLLAIKNHLTKGSIVAFDELNDEDSPGETTALVETFGLNQIRLTRYPYCSRTSYFIVQ